MHAHARANRKISTNRALAAVFFRFFYFCLLHNVHRPFLQLILKIPLQYLCKLIFYEVLKAIGVHIFSILSLPVAAVHY